MFTAADNGWLVAPASLAAIRAAKSRAAAQSEGRSSYYQASARVWAGFLFEAAVARWLTEQGVPFERNGGVDRLPDFVVGETRIGARVRVYAPVPDVLLTWPTAQALPEELLFGVWDEESANVYIAGGISGREFRDRARVAKKGTEIVPRFPADVDVYVSDATILRDPISWLQEIYVREVQFA